MKLRCLSLLLLVQSIGFAQTMEPIFRTKQDSINLEQVKTQLQKLLATTGSQPAIIDSLLTLQGNIQKEGILGYRYTYYPSENYTRYTDLQDGKVNPTEVGCLSLNNYQGKQLPPEIFTCTNLKVLELINTTIETMPKELNNLTSLTSIKIYNNRPSHRLKLKRNNVITHLKIRGDQPHKLPKNYARFKALDSLDLSRNALEEFPRIQRNGNLKELQLNENKLTLTNMKVRKGQPLAHLFLSRNQIKILPKTIGKLTNLKKLTLNYNQITAVDEAFAKLKNLEELSLYSNQLTSIPASVYRLTQLRFIDVYFNSIENVDAAIGNMTRLQVLYLSNNKITSLPDELGKLTNLQELYIHHNRISFLPSSLHQLARLRVLRINENAFSEFPEVILSYNRLENLDISRNLLHKLPAKITELKHLQVLALTENPWDNTDHIEEITKTIEAKGAVVHGL